MGAPQLQHGGVRGRKSVAARASALACAASGPTTPLDSFHLFSVPFTTSAAVTAAQLRPSRFSTALVRKATSSFSPSSPLRRSISALPQKTAGVMERKKTRKKATTQRSTRRLNRGCRRIAVNAFAAISTAYIPLTQAATRQPGTCHAVGCLNQFATDCAKPDLTQGRASGPEFDRIACA